MGNRFMQSLTLKRPLAVNNILSKSAAFEGFEEDVFLRTSPYANLIGPKSRTTVTTKMELFDQTTLCLSILERKSIVLVALPRVLYGV